MGTNPAKTSDIWVGDGRKVEGIHISMDGGEEFVANVGGRRAAPAGRPVGFVTSRAPGAVSGGPCDLGSKPMAPLTMWHFIQIGRRTLKVKAAMVMYV